MHEFCDKCPGCRPAILGLDGIIMADTDPVMQIINEVWDTKTTYEQRKAFINFAMKNARNNNDLILTNEVQKLFQDALHGE